MFKSLIRQDIFRASVFADNLIAEFQQSYATGFDKSLKRDAAFLKEYYDHTIPFQAIDSPIDSHCVLAYAADSKKEFIEVFPIVLQRFLSELNIQELYLLNFNNINLFNFPFENFRKRNLFKLYGGKKSGNFGYVLRADDLHKSLPLFFFSDVSDIPVIFLITAKGDLPLSLHICDDGNLHLNFQKMYEKLIHETAQKVGFKLGDLELCNQHSLIHLN